MSDVAMDPAALRELSGQLARVAGTLPHQRPEAVPVDDHAADAAFHDTNRRLGSYVQECAQVIERTAQQARLTALAFELVDGR